MLRREDTPLRRLLGLLTAASLVAMAACGDGSSTDAEPLHAIPDDPRVVSGTTTCDVLDDEGAAADGTPAPLYVCELDMSDPRVSGTQRDDRWRLVDGGPGFIAWRYEESVITNDEGTWRGAIQAADDGVPCGEAHYVGEEAYEGLEFHYYFCDVDDHVTIRGWISDSG